jgi:hypothetical protein
MRSTSSEIGLGGLGRARHRAGGDEVGKQGSVAEGRGNVGQQHLAGELAGKGRGSVDGQSRDPGTTLGRKEGHDRRRGTRLSLRFRGVDGRQLLLPQPVQVERHLLRVGAQTFEEAVPIQRQQHGVGQAEDPRHVPILGPGGGEDDQVSRGRAAGQEHLALAIGDRLLDLAGRKEHHDIAPVGVKPQRVVRREAHRTHASRDCPKRSVAELREHTGHLQDPDPQLQG